MANKSKFINPAATIGVALVSFLVLSATALADDNPFLTADLDAGYQLAGKNGEEGKCGEGKCGGDMGEESSGGDKGEEGKCGEGKCGGDMGEESSGCDMGEEGKCGEGKCGGDMGEESSGGDKGEEGKCGGDA